MQGEVENNIPCIANSIPVNVTIDPTGKIITKNLRGNALPIKLS